MQPLCYCFVQDDAFEVYWIGLVVAVASVTICNYIYMFTLNWDKIAEEIQARSAEVAHNSRLMLEQEFDENLLNS